MTSLIGDPLDAKILSTQNDTLPLPLSLIKKSTGSKDQTLVVYKKAKYSHISITGEETQ